MKLLHVISGLTLGGAESALHKLLCRMDPQNFQSRVISLSSDQPLGGQIRALGVPVVALGIKPGFPDPRLVTRLREEILGFRPDLIQTWMYHADLVGGIAARLAGSPPVVWNIRHSLLHSSDVKRSTWLVARANAALSRWLPEHIVCCAESALKSHVALGYQRDRMAVIPNGFDLGVFRPDPDARREARRELGVGDEVPLIGMCGRFDPQKDHRGFFHAAGLLHSRFPAVEFVLWGKGLDRENLQLREWVAEQGLADSVHLLGLRRDTPRLDSALDIATLSAAYGEAFPNVIGEAMACAVPCVVTDVGDSAYIVGSTGRAVPPGDPHALAGAWAELLGLSREERLALGWQARQRVAALFDIAQVADAYANLYRDIMARKNRA